MQLELRRTRIEFSISFVIVVALMLIFFDEKIVLLSVASSLLHECGHLLAIKLCGDRTEKVVFGAFGLRIERCTFTKVSYKSEVIIALGGITVNYVIFIICFIIHLVSDNTTAAFFGIINLFIGLLNSVPIKSLDMGKAIMSLLKMKKSEEASEKTAETISIIFSLCFLVFTVFYCVTIGLNFSLIAVSVYLLLDWS